MKKVVITSGYFNPIHPGHIECFYLCKELGDELRVIVNNDLQAKLKNGMDGIFQDQNFRMKVVSSIKGVDYVFLSIDQDASVCESIKEVYKKIRDKYGTDLKVFFGKGGDRFVSNIPEVVVCQDLGIEIRDGLGIKNYNSRDFRNRN